jgi:hypothetical protein
MSATVSADYSTVFPVWRDGWQRKGVLFPHVGRIVGDNTDNKRQKRHVLEEDQDACNATGLGCAHA